MACVCFKQTEAWVLEVLGGGRRWVGRTSMWTSTRVTGAIGDEVYEVYLEEEVKVRVRHMRYTSGGRL